MRKRPMDQNGPVGRTAAGRGRIAPSASLWQQGERPTPLTTRAPREGAVVALEADAARVAPRHGYSP